MYKHVFGPVPSRRLGVSLGVDLVVPKTCNMNCVFCECGSTRKLFTERKRFKDPEEIKNEIKRVLKDVTPDYITFSGSGEPTLSSDIGEIIDWIKVNTKSKVCVITNSLLLEEDKLIDELKNADLIIPTLNSVDNLIFKKINRASVKYDIANVKRGLKKLSENYKGKIYLETFIIEGLNDGDEHTDAMAKFIKTLKIDRLQLNSLDRIGSEKWVKPVERSVLEKIKNRYEMNGITNVEIIKKLEERKEKLKVDDELLKNMQEKRRYTTEELKKIYLDE